MPCLASYLSPVHSFCRPAGAPAARPLHPAGRPLEGLADPCPHCLYQKRICDRDADRARARMAGHYRVRPPAPDLLPHP